MQPVILYFLLFVIFFLKHFYLFLMKLKSHEGVACSEGGRDSTPPHATPPLLFVIFKKKTFLFVTFCWLLYHIKREQNYDLIYLAFFLFTSQNTAILTGVCKHLYTVYIIIIYTYIVILFIYSLLYSYNCLTLKL